MKMKKLMIAIIVLSLPLQSLAISDEAIALDREIASKKEALSPVAKGYCFRVECHLGKIFGDHRVPFYTAALLNNLDTFCCDYLKEEQKPDMKMLQKFQHGIGSNTYELYYDALQLKEIGQQFRIRHPYEAIAVDLDFAMLSESDRNALDSLHKLLLAEGKECAAGLLREAAYKDGLEA